MKRESKKSLKQQVLQADAAKKVNPLDLSSDQDLSIALMNLISIEEHFAFSGAKTQKTGFYDLIDTVHGMRRELMGRIVHGNDAIWDMSKYLLAASMRLMEVGTKALAAGDNSGAYKLFDQAYELYSMFWGINMGLVNLDGVQRILPDAAGNCPLKYGDKSEKPVRSDSVMQKLGNWVKNAVNCCIE